MIDKYLMDQLENVLGQLAAPITVSARDAAACKQLGVPVDLIPGMVQRVDDRLCLPVKQPAVMLICPADVPGAEDMLTLGGALAGSLGSSAGHAENGFDVYRRALLGEVTGAELEALIHEHQLPQELERCVLVFHMVQTGGGRAYDLLADMTPMQDRDVLIDMDRHTVALVKDMTDEMGTDDLIQFSQALQETLLGETALRMTVGIGCLCNNVDELHGSYTEARRAIEVGRLFHPDDNIYAYSRLILERLLMELPAEVSASYHSMLFNRKNTRLFNEEMLYTIDMFFKKDLNLSDTARQLYIHRNTLVYRLDKVQRQTGLDLRSFEDAVTFKILMELKKCGGHLD